MEILYSSFGLYRIWSGVCVARCFILNPKPKSKYRESLIPRPPFWFTQILMRRASNVCANACTVLPKNCWEKGKIYTNDVIIYQNAVTLFVVALGIVSLSELFVFALTVQQLIGKHGLISEMLCVSVELNCRYYRAVYWRVNI